MYILLSYSSRESNFADLLKIRFCTFKFHRLPISRHPLTTRTMQFAVFIFEDGPKNLRKLFPSKKRTYTVVYGISFHVLGSLVHSFPILLLAPLTQSTHHTLTKYTSPPPTGTEAQAAAIGRSWIAKSIYLNMVYTVGLSVWILFVCM